jgi:two-component system response regulator HydG
LRDYVSIPQHAELSNSSIYTNSLVRYPLNEVGERSIPEAVNSCGGNKSEAARRLGITRKTLRKKLDKYESAD